MTPERFAALFEESIEKCRRMAVVKGGEYAPGGDRLANFKTNGEMLGLPPLAIWAVYAGKHWDSIRNFVKDHNKGKDRERSEPIEGRLIDLIVYGFLGLGLLEELHVPNRPPEIDPETRKDIETHTILRMINALINDDPEAVVTQEDPEADLPKLKWYPKAMFALWEQFRAKEPCSTA